MIRGHPVYLTTLVIFRDFSPRRDAVEAVGTHRGGVEIEIAPSTMRTGVGVRKIPTSGTAPAGRVVMVEHWICLVSHEAPISGSSLLQGRCLPEASGPKHTSPLVREKREVSTQDMLCRYQLSLPRKLHHRLWEALHNSKRCQVQTLYLYPYTIRTHLAVSRKGVPFGSIR